MSTLYLQHFGLAEPPFTITPNPKFFFTGAERGRLLEAIVYAVTTDEGITAVVGEVGSGKTLTARLLAEKLSAQGWSVAYLANPAFASNEIVAAVAHDLGLAADPAASAATLLDRLHAALIERYRQGARTVVLIDEAHAMPAASLEEVRRLSNLENAEHKLVQIVLFGQPELISALQAPELRALRERIVHRFVLGPLPPASIRAYLEFRLRAAGLTGHLPFTPLAIRRIAKVARGIARRINLLADKALLAAFARGSKLVAYRDVRRAERELEWGDLPYLARADQSRRWAWLAWGVAAAAFLLAVAIGQQEHLVPRLESLLARGAGQTNGASESMRQEPPEKSSATVATAALAPETTTPIRSAQPNPGATLPSDAPVAAEKTAPPSPTPQTTAASASAPAPSPAKATPPQPAIAAAPAKTLASPPAPANATASSRTSVTPSALASWQGRGSHAVLLTRWDDAPSPAQIERRLAPWRRLTPAGRELIAIPAPNRAGEVWVLIGPYVSPQTAAQEIVTFPAEWLLLEPRVLSLQNLRK